MQVLLAHEVRKTYPGAEEPVEAVRGVSLALNSGDLVAVMGPSGCGKSTLLHLCGAMDRPSSGRIEVEGVQVAELNEHQLTRLRRERIGFVFQFFNLLPTLTVSENIGLPLMLAGATRTTVESRACYLAERVGLKNRLHHYPQQLSGGEMQRAAIARAIIHNPVLLIADEPTGNLDTENGAVILQLLAELNAEGITMLLATHSSEIAAMTPRVLHMRDGVIEGALDPRLHSR